MIKSAKTLAIGCLTIISIHSQANGIILNEENLRNDLNWLNQQGVIQISTSTWPLSEAELSRALSKAVVNNNIQQKVIDKVSDYLKLENNKLILDVFTETEQQRQSQFFANKESAQHHVGIGFKANSEHWASQIKINVEKDQIIENDQKVNVEGSYLGVNFWNQWFIAGQIPTYWGPGYEGSLIRGDASRPVYGVTLQRVEQKAFESSWLSWIGNWQYQMFAGQLDDYQSIPNAKLLGLRVTMQPRPYLEIGASRIFQWGGDGKDESLSGLWEAIKGNDNVDDRALDKSNQLAGIDVKFNFNSFINLPLGLYGQLIGEDEAGYLPSRKFHLLGIDYSSKLSKFPIQLYLEMADTRTNGKVWGYTYSHGDYKDGYYQHGYPLGYSIGGDSQIYSMGGNIIIDRMNRLSGRVLTSEINQSSRDINYKYPTQEKIKALEVSWTHYIDNVTPLKLKGWLNDSNLNGSDSGLALSLEVPLDKLLFK